MREAAAVRRAPTRSRSRSRRTSWSQSETSYTRKIKEALLALRIGRAYWKDKILELYLNEIYLGLGAYGIAAASLIYFDKSVHQLTLPEMAYLAALPKAPTSLHPFRARDRAIERRNWVVDRMVENGYASSKDGATAKAAALNVTPRPTGAHVFAAEYFAEEVRRPIYDRYGEKNYRRRPFRPHDAQSEIPGDRKEGAHRRPRALRRSARLARGAGADRRPVVTGA